MLDLVKIRTGKPIHVYRTTRVVVPKNRTYPLKDLPAETQPAHSEAGGADPEPLTEEQTPEESAVVIHEPPPQEPNAVIQPGNGAVVTHLPAPEVEQPPLAEPPHPPVEGAPASQSVTEYRPGEEVEERLLITRKIPRATSGSGTPDKTR